MGKVNYSLVQRRNPAKKDAPKQFYASAQKTGDLTYDEIKKEISLRTTATAGDVALVIESLISDITSGLKAGKAVFLDKLGKFRLSFSSKGVATAKEFTTDLIKGIRIVFTPCKELKLTKKELSFELAPTRKEQAAAVKKIKNGTEVVVPKDPEKPATGGDTTGGGSGVGA
jgi:predicted histone-like DNA-binding protein